MKKLITIFTLIPFLLIGQQTYEWEEASFAKTANTYIPLSKIAITADNHKIIAGRFEQSMEYKGVTLTSSLYYGAFIAKLDENDSLLWIRKFVESNQSTTALYSGLGRVRSLDIKGSDYFYLIINFTDSIFVDNQLYIGNDSISIYGQDLLLKFDLNGNILQDFYLNGSCGKELTNMYIDENKNKYFFGSYYNDQFSSTDSCTCSFDSITTYTTEEAEVFLVKYDSLGNLLWVNTFGNSKNIGPTGFSVIDDAIYISGGSFYASDVDFGPYTLSFPSNYSNAAFMAKYDTSGVFKWAKYYGVKGWDSHVSPNDLLALSDNKIIVTGSVRTQSESAHLYFQNSSPLTRYSAGLELNYYIICYDSLGNIVWKDLALCGGQDYIASIAIDKDKNLYATGQYNQEMYFGNDTLPFAYDRLFVAAFDSIGTKLWAKDIGGGGGNSGIDIALDSDDNIYVNGWTTANPTIVGDSTYTTYGPSIFLAKMVPSLISNTTVIPLANTNKQLIKIVDVLGRETKAVKGRLLFYIYSDGTVEKQIFLN